MTKFWGPKLWYLMHYVSYGYSNKPTKLEKLYFYLFFLNITNIIPCDECKKHYEFFLRIYPIKNYLYSKNQLIDWVIFLHNSVNKKLDKEHFTKENVDNLYIKNIDNEIIKETIKYLIDLYGFNNKMILLKFLEHLVYVYPDKKIKIKLLNNHKLLKKYKINEWFDKFKKITES